MILEHAVKTCNVAALRELMKTVSLEAMDEPDDNGRTPLILACFRGNIQVIRLLLKGGSSTHSRDKWGKTALMYAVQRNHIDVVRILLKANADPTVRDNEDRSVEEFARPSSPHFNEMIELLRQSENYHEESQIGMVKSPGRSSSGRPKSLLPGIKMHEVRHKASFCHKDPLVLARRGLNEELKAILPEVGGVSKFGLNQPDDCGRTPLMIAILNGKLESCLILIKAGGEVDDCDFTGKTVLFYAITKRNMEAVQALLEAGANVNAVDKFGRTPLMQGSMDGYVQVVKLLLSAGAQLESIDNKGRSALMYAVSKGHIATIEELIKSGANPMVKDHAGKRVEKFGLTRSNFDHIRSVLYDARLEWKVKHPSLYDSISLSPERSSYQSPPFSPIKKEEEALAIHQEDSFFGSPSRVQSRPCTVSPKSGRKRAAPLFASPFNPKANRSALELVRIADYATLDSFLDGVSIDAVNERDSKAGRTALMVAALQQKMVPLQMLIDAGADLNLKDNQGKTALSHAVAIGNSEIVQKLLEAGAREDQMDANGRKPLEQAEMGGSEKICTIIKENSFKRIGSRSRLPVEKSFFEGSDYAESGNVFTFGTNQENEDSDVIPLE